MFRLFLIALVLLTVSCGSGNSIPEPERINFGNSEQGIFDPSIDKDSGSSRLWMSYSAVNDSTYYPADIYWTVSIRLAYSDDNGQTWQDAGLVSSATESLAGPMATTTPPAPAILANTPATWQSETSALVFDPAAPAGERWKVFWYQYMFANAIPYAYDYSWIAMKAAATPAGLLTASPVKLFGHNGMQADGENTAAPYNSPLGGPAQINLSTLDAEINACVFGEPGLHATTSALYMSINCADVSGTSVQHYVVYFKCTDPCTITSAASWSYLGRLLTPVDAATDGHTYYSGTDIVEQGGRFYLVATPTLGESYDGCRVFEFASIDSSSLRRTGGSLIEIVRVSGTTGLHHGACDTYNGVDGGLIYSQYEPANPPNKFRLYKSFVLVP